MPLNLLKSYQTAFPNPIFILILFATYHSSSISMSNQTLAIIYLCDYIPHHECEVFSQYSYDLSPSVAQWYGPFFYLFNGHVHIVVKISV